MGKDAQADCAHILGSEPKLYLADRSVSLRRGNHIHSGSESLQQELPLASHQKTFWLASGPWLMPVAVGRGW